MPRLVEANDIMESSSSDTGSSLDKSGNPLFPVDIENQNQERGGRRRNPFIRVWKIPLPFRKDHLGPDLVKNIACLMTLLCIAQFAYIKHLADGLIRVPNDPFDNRFGQDVDRHSPSIWDSNRQSFIHDVLPVPVHSHNDYLRRIPLFEALGSGCISVEADVHLHNSDLFVGHTTSEAQNAHITDGAWRGVFDLAPQHTLVLLVDHKTSGPETFAELHMQLQPLRDLDYLTYWNGTARVIRPLTIVASGTAPFQSVTALDAMQRDIFWDAKLERLVSANDNFEVEPVVYEYNPANSYFASTEFQNAILQASHNKPTSLPDTPQLKDISATQIEQAKARGLIARYWNTPAQPPNLREIVWRVLVDYQVGILNMDDMGTVRARAKE